MSLSLHRPQTFRTTLLALFLLVLLPALAQAAEREVKRSFDLGKGGEVSLSNINGDVTIEGWSSDQVEVRAVISSRSQEATDDTEVRFEHRGGSLEIETELPSRRGGWLGQNQNASVEYWLKVPSTVRMDDISLVNGSLKIRDVEGNIEASLVNGSLDARGLRGDAELSTVNGSIEVRFDQLDGTQRIDIESVNGSIEVFVPGGADADFSAETVHGRIRNDFGMKVEKEGWVGSELRDRMGSGSARVTLENVNGSIDIREN